MSLKTAKLQAYTTSGVPAFPGGDRQYVAKELAKVRRAIDSIEQIMSSMETAGTVRDKAGAVVAADLADGEYQVIHDTVGATVKLYANIGGTLMSVGLA